MGIADRARDAVRTTNSIEAVAPLENASRVKVDAAPPTFVPDANQKKAASEYTKQALDRYYVEGTKNEQRHYDDYQKKSLAFTANNSSVTSKREDLNTVKAMVAQAELRGWQTVELKGTTDFKREAWIETQTRGIEAKGYKPSDPDRQEADRRRGERERGQTNEVRNVTQPSVQSRTPSLDPVAPSTDRAQSPTAKPLPLGEQVVAKSPVIAVASRSDIDKQAEVSVAPTKRSQESMRDRAEGKSGPPVDRSANTLNGASLVKTEKPAPVNGSQPEKEAVAPSLAENRKIVRDSPAALSPDGRIMFAALSEIVDRQMNKQNVESKTELKAFVATELLKKERVEGPVVLSAEQRLAASAPEPVRQAPREPSVQQTRRVEPEAPRRSIGR